MKFQKGLEYWTSEEGLLLLGGWARDGKSQTEIAESCGIPLSTLKKWMKSSDDLRQVVECCPEAVDYQVENALLKKAMAGNTSAQIFWLKNRRPDKWQKKAGTDSGEGETEIIDDV